MYEMINNIIWGPVMIALILGTGVFFSVKTNFLQLRKFMFMLKKTILSIFRKTSNTNNKLISPFQALTTALAGTIGTGNIVGTASAIAIGGPGALFWIVFSSFFGMITKYAEILLAVKYRVKKSTGKISGGPMYYIEHGLGNKFLALAFSVFGLLASFGIGNMAQINSISTSMYSSLKINPLFTGVVMAIVVSLVIIGNVQRIAKTTEKIVPFMAVFYIFITIIILIKNYHNISSSIILIIQSAFKKTAAVGGFVGSSFMLTIKSGISKGVFTNEAGLGSSPIAHAMADTKHPVDQAMWGIFEVFVDTILICSITGLAIISSGKWSSGLSGVELAISSYSEGLGNLAPYAISFCLLFFAFLSLLGWSFYGEKCLEYVVKTDKFNNVYKIVFSCVIVIGATSDIKVVWDISDALNGLMAIPNLIALLFLSNEVIKTTNDYFI